MIRRISIAAFVLLTATLAVAQSPKGWMVRVDRSMSASDPDGAGSVKFVTTASGFHATNPQAAVFWNPANTATGNYTLKGNFTLLKPSGHTNYYGLVFGGSGLEGGQQTYIYFMVAQDGIWLLNQRSGNDATPTVAGPTRNSAVKMPDASGKSVNALEVRVKANSIDYLVNGAVVHTTPKSGLTAKTDGLYGLRVNHLLDVQADGLTVIMP